jgi:hypothetical protein
MELLRNMGELAVRSTQRCYSLAAMNLKHANGEASTHHLRLICYRHCEPQAKQPRNVSASTGVCLGFFVAYGFSQ